MNDILQSFTQEQRKNQDFNNLIFDSNKDEHKRRTRHKRSEKPYLSSEALKQDELIFPLPRELRKEY
jgi:hypothetical protein